jgi:hypothetical protein
MHTGVASKAVLEDNVLSIVDILLFWTLHNSRSEVSQTVK